jgi:cell division protein ZapA (FtsZ GTPase activity inhibitor)
VKKNAVKVVIVDEEYTVRSELDPDYTRQVAAHVDTAIRRVLASGPMAQRLKQLSGELTRLLPPQKRQSVGA